MSDAALVCKRSREIILKMSLNNIQRKPIILTNVEIDLFQEFPSLTDADRSLAIYRTMVSNYSKSDSPYKGYKISLG